MNFDINKTLGLIKGGLFDHRATWERYLGENPSWRDTLIQLTGPLLVVNVVLSVILSRIMGTMSAYTLGANWFTGLLLGLVLAALAFAVAVFVFNFLAGMFGGKPDFSRAFAAISLAAIPAWIAGIIGSAIPWLGGLISLAGAIVSLVFVYQVMPLALGIPDNKRVVHFVASLVVILVINLIIGRVLGMGAMDARSGARDFGSTSDERDAGKMPGMFGEIGRQAELYAKAGEARFDPPSDGEVTRQQARWVADTLTKANATYQEEMARLKALSEDLDNKERPSPADLAKMYQGMGTVMSLSSVEMETVMSGDGNWAEYQWVKSQLRDARLQRGEGSPALEHNYKLYEEIKDQVQGGL
jgi:hypothetical protein